MCQYFAKNFIKVGSCQKATPIPFPNSFWHPVNGKTQVFLYYGERGIRFSDAKDQNVPAQCRHLILKGGDSLVICFCVHQCSSWSNEPWKKQLNRLPHMRASHTEKVPHIAWSWTYGKGRQGRQLTSLSVGLEVVSVSYWGERWEKNMSMCKKSEKGKEIWG